MLSPASTFMSANQYSFKDDQTGETVLTFGPMSSIDEVIMIVHIQICCRECVGVASGGSTKEIILLLRLRVLIKPTSFYQGGDLGDNFYVDMSWVTFPSYITPAMHKFVHISSNVWCQYFIDSS